MHTSISSTSSLLSLPLYFVLVRSFSKSKIKNHDQHRHHSHGTPNPRRSVSLKETSSLQAGLSCSVASTCCVTLRKSRRLAFSRSMPDIFHAATTELTSTTAYCNSYSFFTLCIVFTGAVGGIVTAMVMKYTDSIIKLFSVALAIVFTSVISYFLFGSSMTLVCRHALTFLDVFVGERRGQQGARSRNVVRVASNEQESSCCASFPFRFSFGSTRCSQHYAAISHGSILVSFRCSGWARASSLFPS